MNEDLPPPFPGPVNNPAPAPEKSNKTRNILLGCGLAFLIVVGLLALLLTMVCSGLNNMH